MRRLTASFLCMVYILTETAWGLNAMNIEVRPIQETPAFLQIEIPEELAVVDEVYEAPAKLEPRLILNIQNAHGSYDAQTQIKKLLGYLHDAYGFDLLFVEGASEELKPDNLKMFKDPEKNAELAEYMARKGEITGPDLYLLDAPDSVKGVGIEQPELYRGNLEAFRVVTAGKSDVDNFMATFESRLDFLSSRFFSHDIRKLLSEWQKFQAGQRDFLPYINRISKAAKKYLDLDLESLFAQVEWPQITRLLVIQSMEKDVDRELAKQEKINLIEFLKDRNVSKSLIKGIEQLEEKRIYMNRLNPDSDSEKYLPRHLLERLVEEAGPAGFQFHNYPAFSLYAGYLILQSELESRALFEEIEHLFGKILDELTVTDEEKDLLEIFRDAELLKKLLNLEITRKEFSRVSYRMDWIQPGAMVKRLHAVKRRMMTGKKKYTGDPGVVEVSLSSAMPKVFTAAISFYDFATRRETAFYSKIKSEMTKRNVDKAVLITGGFHTEGLMDLFREDEVSYGILTPHIRQIEGKDNYVATMMQDHPSMFDLANLETFNLLQSFDGLAELGVDQQRLLTSRVQAFFEIGRFRSIQEAENALNDLNGLYRGYIRLELSDLEAADGEGVAGSTGIHIYFGPDQRPFVSAEGERIVVPLQQKNGVVRAASHFETGGRALGGVTYAAAPTLAAPAPVDVVENSTSWSPDGAIVAVGGLGVFGEDAVTDLPAVEESETAEVSPSIRLADIGDVTDMDNAQLALAEIDQIVANFDIADPAFGALVIALLVNNFVGLGADRTPDAFVRLHSVLTQQFAPTTYDFQENHPVLGFDNQAAMPTFVLERNTTLTADQITLVGELLALPSNGLIRINFILPTDDIAFTTQSVNAAYELAESRWVENGIDAENVKERLVVKGISQTRMNREIPRTVNQGLQNLRRDMRTAGQQVPSLTTLQSNYTSMLYNALLRRVPVDLMSGASAPYELDISPQDLFMAAVIAGTYLAIHGATDPATVSQKTLAALQIVDEFDNRWQVENAKLEAFAQLVQDAIDAMQTELRIAYSA